MLKQIKQYLKASLAIAVGLIMTGCVISFSPPELSDNFPEKFGDVPMAKALPKGVTIDVDDTFNDGGALDDVLESSAKIGIAGFTVHFVTEDRASASTGDGGSAVMDVALGGVSKAQLQKITDAAYADFVAQLQTSGREVIPVEKIRATSGYRGINFDGPSGSSWNTGMDTQILADQERTIITAFWASGLPGWHVNPLGVGNQAVTPWISGEAQAVIITVSLTVSIVEFSSSGRGSSWFSSDASVSAKPRIKVTSVRFAGHFTDNPPGGVTGSYIQDHDEPIIVDGDFGEIKEGASNTRKIGTNRLSKSGYTLVANPKKFSALVLKGIQASNAAFVQFANDNKP